MSQLTHPRLQFVDLQFRARTWLAALAAVVVVAIPAALIVAPGDESTPSAQPTAAGLRYDGGPNEGTRGISAQDVGQGAQPTAAGLRYDGGPNEGTRGISAQDASQSISVRGSSDTFGLRP